jgi:hypothetical protein
VYSLGGILPAVWDVSTFFCKISVKEKTSPKSALDVHPSHGYTHARYEKHLVRHLQASAPLPSYLLPQWKVGRFALADVKRQEEIMQTLVLLPREGGLFYVIFRSTGETP